MSSRVCKIFIVFSVSVYIFGWKITSYIDIIVASSVCLFVLYMLFFRGTIYRDEIIILSAIIALIIYTGILTVLYGSIDIFFFLRHLRVLINFLGAIALIGIAQRCVGQKYVSVIFTSIYLALVMHAALIISMYLWDPLRIIVYQITDAYSYVNLNYPFLTGLRISGLTYGLSQTSVVQMFGISITPFVYKYIRFKTGFWMSIIILFLSLFLTGRTGIVFSILFAPLSFLIASESRREKFLRALSNTAIIVMLGTFMLKSFPFIQTKSFFLEKFFGYNIRVAKEIISIIVSPDNSPFLITMRRMVIVPGDWLVFIFGNSMSGRSETYYLPSDIGYIRLLFGLGVLGLVIVLLLHLLFLYYGIRIYKLNKAISVATVIMITSVLLLNAKELALLTRNSFSLISLLEVLSIRIYRRSRLK